MPGAKVTHQGHRRLRPDRRRRAAARSASIALQTPAMIRFGELTEDEVFVSYDAARKGVTFENTGTEPLVTLRYFGPDTNPQAPNVGDHKRPR